MITKHLRHVPAWAFLSLLVACGGGGGGGSGTQNSSDNGSSNTPQVTALGSPTLALAMQGTKTFHFTWTSIPAATEYQLLEDPDGASGYTKIASLNASATSADNVVFLPERVNAKYVLNACNSAGCTSSAPIAVSGNLTQAVGYVKASNTDASDVLGVDVSLSADGTTLAVGAPSESSSAGGVNGNQADNSSSQSGAVYVFKKNRTTWSQQAYIKASNPDPGDHFGFRLSLSADGNTLAVATYFEDGGATGINGAQNDNSSADSGAVYIYARSGNNWSQQAYIKASNTSADGLFGNSVALSADGNILAVGSPGENSNATGIDGDQTNTSASSSGAVYVFVRSGATWSQQAYVKASNTDSNDAFGYSLSLSSDGKTLAVGSYFENSNATGINGDQTDNSANASGAVYVFTRTGATWSQQAYIKSSNDDPDDHFGNTISLSADGNTLAVGVPDESSNATGINGDQANNAALQSGAAYVFTRSGTTWSQQAYVKASNTAMGQAFGSSISLSADGNTLAVGANYERSNATGINGNQADTSLFQSGAVYLFTRNGTVWSQEAYVKASNTSTNADFGVGLSLSGDGKTLAVGAPGESSNATGINGNQADHSAVNSGAVYLY